MKDDAKPVAQTLRRALSDLLPPGLVVGAVRDVFPREVMGEAFREGLALFFSPFMGFWRALGAAIRGQGLRDEDVRQHPGAE